MINYKDPGTGAIEFTKRYTEGCTSDEALSVIQKLLRGELHDSTDKRVKRCNYCGYYWRDDSLRNTRRTCSEECKRGIKTLQRRQQRADKELLNPKPRKHKLMDDYYYWYEYPFWVNEYSMIKVGERFEVPWSSEKMSIIEAKQSIYGKGNRKIPARVIDYHGDKQNKF